MLELGKGPGWLGTAPKLVSSPHVVQMLFYDFNVK
jgi:hypothetical protein